MITALNKVGLATSNGEARRPIRGGGARLNDAQINDESKTLSPDDFIDGKAKISAGKKTGMRCWCLPELLVGGRPVCLVVNAEYPCAFTLQPIGADDVTQNARDQ